jgi:hypothetical protein
MSYGFEWIPGLVLAGTALVLLLVPAFALIGLAVLALVALAAVVALAGAVVATPYLLARTLRRRLAERHHAVSEIATFRAELSGPQVG